MMLISLQAWASLTLIKVANGYYVEVKGKGDIDVETPSGTKFISNVLLIPEIRQNLLSVGQMLENHYALHFKDKSSIIYDPPGNELMTMKMKERSFLVDWNQIAMHAYHIF